MDENGHPRNGVVVALRKIEEDRTQDDWTSFLDGQVRPRQSPAEELDDTECANWLGHLREREGTAVFDLFPLAEQEREPETPPWWLLFPLFAIAMIVAFIVGQAVTRWLFPLIGGW